MTLAPTIVELTNPTIERLRAEIAPLEVEQEKLSAKLRDVDRAIKAIARGTEKPSVVRSLRGRFEELTSESAELEGRIGKTNQALDTLYRDLLNEFASILGSQRSSGDERDDDSGS